MFLIDFKVKSGSGFLHFKIELKGKVTQILGDSSTGKTLFGTMFYAKNPNDVLYIDYRFEPIRNNLKTIIKETKATYIIFDNFDELGGAEFDEFIAEQSQYDDKIYIIISQDCLMCTEGLYTVGSMVNKSDDINNETLYFIDYTLKG